MRSTSLFIGLWISSIAGFADAKGMHLCSFGKALVPCIQLPHPVEALEYTFQFRPTKWIPLWPTNAIFGGRSDNALWHDVEFANINKVQTFDKAKPNIETLEPIPPDFGPMYVDPNLAESSTWMGPETKRYVNLINTKRAFHGDRAFEFWTQATNAGVVCADFSVPYGSKSERHCVFARSSIRENPRNIEYCTFQLFTDSGIADTPICTGVASEQNDVRKVLATKYVEWDYDGGESAGEYTCRVPNASQDEVRRTVTGFVKNFIGKSSKYFETNEGGTINYKAEGINIKNEDEHMFLRAYLFGSYFLPEKSKVGTNENFTINANVTVSAQASDNIVDYREPTPAMGDRLRNGFNASLQKAVRAVWGQAVCKLE